MKIPSLPSSNIRRALETAGLCLVLSACSGGGGGGDGGGGGGGGNGGVPSAPANNVPRFAYVANLDSTVSIYTVNAATGQLRANGYAAAGTSPVAVTTDPLGRFAYVVNLNSSDVSAYAIDAGTGTLTSVGPAVTAGTEPRSVSVDPSGRFAYVANEASNDISAYAISATNGALFQINCGGAAGVGCNGANFATGISPFPVIIDPAGRFAYAVNAGSNDISAYAINAATGALTPVNCGGGAGCNGANFAAGTNPFGIAIDPAGRFVYVTNVNGNTVSTYGINASSGALTGIGPAVLTGTFPVFVAVDPSGRFAYVANQGSNDVSAYRIDAASGALTQVVCATAANCNGANFAAGTEPRSVAVDPSGRFVYVANQSSGDVSAYEIDTATGALTNSKVPVTAGSGPRSVTVDTTGRFVYVANFNSGAVSAYSIDVGDGTLRQIDCGGGTGCNGANFAAGSNPVSVSVEASGRYAYVVNEGADSVSIFAIAPVTGALEPPVGTAAVAGTGTRPRSVAIDPSGRFAYVANAGTGDVSAYTVDGDAGALARLNCSGAGCSGVNFSAGPNPLSVAVDPSGGFAYVANFLSDNISIYTIDAASGALTGAGTVAAGTGPYAVTTTGTIR